MEQIVRLSIAEDHPIMLKGICDILSGGIFQIDIEASDGNELIDKLRKAENLPDICIIDISMPGLNGYELLKEIRKNWTSVKVLVLSEFYDEYSALEMLRSGANGYLQKNCTPQQLHHALANIYYHEYYYTASVSKKISEMNHYGAQFPKITDREMEFLQHCCSELSYKEIGELMGISARTVEAYRNALFDKLQLKTRTGLAMFALQNGIVPLNRAAMEEN